MIPKLSSRKGELGVQPVYPGLSLWYMPTLGAATHKFATTWVLQWTEEGGGILYTIDKTLYQVIFSSILLLIFEIREFDYLWFKPQFSIALFSEFWSSDLRLAKTRFFSPPHVCPQLQKIVEYSNGNYLNEYFNLKRMNPKHMIIPRNKCDNDKKSTNTTTLSQTLNISRATVHQTSWRFFLRHSNDTEGSR